MAIMNFEDSRRQQTAVQCVIITENLPVIPNPSPFILKFCNSMYIPCSKDFWRTFKISDI